MSQSATQYLLDASRMPKYWYNIAADLPSPPPAVLHPGTLQPIGPADLAPLFPMELIMQEVSTEREIAIPEPVREVFKLWRPAPLYRAHRLEKALGTPAKIYYKYEGVSPAGSHKPNTAVPQAWYNAQAGVKKLTTETGAGQWGSSLSFAGNLFGLDVTVFQVRVSYDQKPYRRALMETYGARCVASPSNETNYGRAVLAQRADHPGSLGIAISEAVEIARRMTTPSTPWVRCSTTCCCTRPSSGKRPCCSWRWPATTPMSSSAAPAAAATSPASPSPSSANSCAVARSAASWRWSPPPARRSPAASTPTTLATPAT